MARQRGLAHQPQEGIGATGDVEHRSDVSASFTTQGEAKLSEEFSQAHRLAGRARCYLGNLFCKGRARAGGIVAEKASHVQLPLDGQAAGWQILQRSLIVAVNP
jgi:hypothetical protein